MFTFILPIYLPPSPDYFTLDESIGREDGAFDPQEDVLL